MQYKSNVANILARYKDAVLTEQVIDSLAKAIRGEMEQSLLEIFSDSIASGVLGVHIENGQFPLCLANDSLIAWLGYTREEFTERFAYSITGIVHPEDFARCAPDIAKLIETGAPARIQVRLLRKDGSTLWVVEHIKKLVDDAGKPMLFSILVDITEIVELQQELQLKTTALQVSEERFRIALERSTNVIFDYDIGSCTISHSRAANYNRDFTISLDEAQSELVQAARIVDSSMVDFYRAFEQIDSGGTQASCVIVAEQYDGSSSWHRITLAAIKGDSGVSLHAVGMMEDITRQKLDELALMRKSERDPMTGVYNKTTTEQLIRERLQSLDGMQTGVFMMIDVDNFKHINDTYGHPFGDKTLINAVSVISSSFRDDDIVGRLGGDEFCVFFTGMRSRRRVEQSAIAICDGIKAIFDPQTGAPGVSCSIGIAMCAGLPKSFEELYHEADGALYEAKGNGRNCYCFSPQAKVLLPNKL